MGLWDMGILGYTCAVSYPIDRQHSICPINARNHHVALCYCYEEPNPWPDRGHNQH